MNLLKENLDQFVAPVYGKTQRSPNTYVTVKNYCTENLVRLVANYHAVQNDQQLLREIRNDIDYYLRRYHEYCIEQRDGIRAHYREIDADAETDFEHLIPASRIRDLLLADAITVEQALNAPTVLLSRDKHRLLKEEGWGSRTPNMWLPFQRYSNIFSARYVTYDGHEIDPKTWTLEDHYNYFKHLVI